MKKITILLAILAISILSATYMHIQKSDGSTLNFNINYITDINYVSGANEFIEPTMILVPAGSFQMGQVDVAEPVHTVTLTNDYYLGKYEITNQEYCNMLNYSLNEGLLAGDYENNTSVMNLEGDQKTLIQLDYVYGCDISYVDGSFVVDEGLDNRPAVSITWYGAAFYCNILSLQNNIAQLYNLADWSCNIYPDGIPGYRLPTEAEWEYAARYNDNRTYTWGNEEPAPGLAHFYYSDNPNAGHSIDVGTLPDGNSELGFCNMAGNVWEWCNDYSGNYSGEAQTNPTGSAYHLRKVVRSGSWLDNPIYTLPSMKAARREDTNPATGDFTQGFRIVRITE